MDSNSVTIYTDGACSNNGRQCNAKAGIGVYWSENSLQNVSEPLTGRQTNQRAEIVAATRGINQAKEQGYTHVTVRTDSNYVKNAAESWIPNWDKKNSWGKVVNAEEFQGLKNSMKEISVKFEKVPSQYNSADKLARASLVCRKFIH